MPSEEVHLEVQSVPTSKNDMKVPPEKEAGNSVSLRVSKNRL
jgi:hypothetical protein